MSNYSKTEDTNITAVIFAGDLGTRLRSVISKKPQVIETLTPGKLDADIVRNMTLKEKIDLENNTFIKAISLDKWDKSGEAFQEFLSDNLMSGHMWAVAKK